MDEIHLPPPVSSPLLPHVSLHGCASYIFRLLERYARFALESIHLPDPPSSGIFFVLFIFAIHTLSSRRTHGKSILIAATWVMFIVGTTRLVLHLAQTAMSVYAVQESIQNPAGLKPVRRLLFVLELTQNALFKLNVLVETSILIGLVDDKTKLWRCYVIWGKRKDVVILPGALVAATTAVLIAFCVTRCDSDVSFDSMSAVEPKNSFHHRALHESSSDGSNRIWWIRQQARRICGHESIFEQRYGMAPTLIALFDAVANQGVNILPTLMVVRVGLGRNIQDTIQDIARPSFSKLGSPV
ncbi:hypothetical protein B0H13DRAFT_2279398 [Mycena leptocephala]|nr:hypothetical protein B0H13DRAFT_2279398 [Mycena leptocephala]